MSPARLLACAAALAGSLLCGAQPLPTASSPPSDSAPASAAASGAEAALPKRCKSGDASASCCCGASSMTLRLDGLDEARLPDARVGQSYALGLPVQGGKPPYRFSLIAGQALPKGLSMDSEGGISGEAATAGRYQWSVQAQDASGQRAQHRYALLVRPAAAKPASAAAATTTAPASAVISVAPPQAASQPARGLASYVYKLSEDALKTLQAEPPPPPESEGTLPAPPSSAEDAGPKLDKEQMAALQQMLASMLGIEYPSQALFESALDLRLCQHTKNAVLAAAAKAKRAAPSDKELSAWCPPDWAAAKRSAKPATTDSGKADAAKALPLKDWPTQLLPLPLRERLIELARQPHAGQTLPSIRWQGMGCGCLRDDLDGKQVYGFFPSWWAGENLQPDSSWLSKLPLLGPAQPVQRIDFSMLSRISYFALPLDAELTPLSLGELTADNTAFIREARRHRSQLDLSLLANDWRFLVPLPQAESEAQRLALLKRLTQQLPRQARSLIDLPLPGINAKALAWLPAFGEAQHLADGITLVFDALPAPSADASELRQAFRGFYPQLIGGLIKELRKGTRPYALNLVINDADFGGEQGLFEFKTLFELIKQAELPAAEPPYFKDDRIVESTGDYRSATHVTLRLLVLLKEPSTLAKKALHQRVEADSSLRGINRRVFFRKIIPLLPAQVSDARQFSDDLAYFEDNFGGVGFWPLLMQPTDQAVNEELTRAFSSAADDGIGRRICAFECEHRWWFRALFELALLVGAVTFGLLHWRCELRRSWSRFIYSGGALVAALSLLLQACDPAFERWRQSGVLMWLLGGLLVLGALWNWLKPKVDKP